MCGSAPYGGGTALSEGGNPGMLTPFHCDGGGGGADAVRAEDGSRTEGGGGGGTAPCKDVPAANVPRAEATLRGSMGMPGIALPFPWMFPLPLTPFDESACRMACICSGVSAATSAASVELASWGYACSAGDRNAAEPVG